MKYRTTRKRIYEDYGRANVFSIGNGNLQNLLHYERAFAYSTRAEGWACDYYNIGKGIVLSDGYAPIGKKIDFDTMRLFDQKANEILEKWRYEDYEKCQVLIGNLIADFIGTIKGGN